jgi:ubiquinone/menaquinone biosynthesis C-methylase UbiE
MTKNPFDIYPDEYENWFIKNELLFQSELLALKQVVPTNKKGIEIGVGSGLFAEKLNIKFGIDPSEKMLEFAKQRKIIVEKGVAENLPYTDNSFDFAVFVTSICFVENPEKAIKETYRILNNNGEIIIAFIDKESSLGQILEKNKNESKFYKDAKFFSVKEIVELIETNGFLINSIFQTLTKKNIKAIEQPLKGYEKGSFIVIKGNKKAHNKKYSAFGR